MNVNKITFTRTLPSVMIVIIAIGVIIWELHNIYQLSLLEKQKNQYFVEKQEFIKKQIIDRINERLTSEFEKHKNNILSAENNPFVKDNDLLLFQSDQQVLPRSTKFKPDKHSTVKALYDKLLSIEPILLVSSKKTPWAERGKLLADFKLTIRAQHAEVSKLALMDILSHFQINRDDTSFDSNEDLAFLAAISSYLVKFGSPTASMMKAIISGGMTSIDGAIMPGLQSLLLLSRSKMTQDDFDYFRQFIVQLSKKYDVEHSRFDKLSQRQIKEYHLDGNLISDPSISNDGQWYVAPKNDNAVWGYRINLDQLLTDSVEYMKALGVLDFPVNVSIRHASNAYYSVNDIDIMIDADDWVNSNSSHRYLASLVSLVLILLLSALLYFLSLQIRSQKYLTMKNDFIAAVSHDIKSPLSAIHLLSQTLVSRLHQNKDVKYYPEKILSNSKRLRNLTENILIFYGVDENLKKPSLSKTSIAAVLENVQSFSECDNLKQLNIIVRGQTNICIQADGELLALVFNNLINNSCKYNTDQMVEIEISVSTNASNTKTVISLKDNGVGIPEKEWQRIFEPYYINLQPHSPHKKGVGIGLSLCRKIMVMHQGKIEIADSNDAGTTINLIFPIFL